MAQGLLADPNVSWLSVSALDSSLLKIARDLHCVAAGGEEVPLNVCVSNTQHSNHGGHHWFTVAYSIRRIPTGCEPETAVVAEGEGGAAGMEDAEEEQMRDATCDAWDEWDEQEMRMADAMLDDMDW